MLPTATKQYHFASDIHAHFLGNSPLIGTTTVLSILDKPLAFWASGLACAELGWMNSKLFSEEVRLRKAKEYLSLIGAMNEKQYLALLDKAYKAHSVRVNKAKTSGVDMHRLLEEYIEGEIAGTGTLLPDPIIKPFVSWSQKNVKKFLFSELHCYSEVLHTGGIADFGFIDMENKRVLGDFKSSKGIYFSMWLQCSGYDMELLENGGFTPDGQLIYEPGQKFDYHAIFAEKVGLDKPEFNFDVARTKRAFSCCVQLYKEKLFWEKDNEKV